MTLALLLSLQAAAPAPPPSLPSAPPSAGLLDVDFDLAHWKPPASACSAADRVESGGILVCGRRPSTAYPLERMARIFEAGPGDAETGLFGTVRGGAYVQSVAYSNGTVAKRIMVGIKLPF